MASCSALPCPSTQRRANWSQSESWLPFTCGNCLLKQADLGSQDQDLMAQDCISLPVVSRPAASESPKINYEWRGHESKKEEREKEGQEGGMEGRKKGGKKIQLKEKIKRKFWFCLELKPLAVQLKIYFNPHFKHSIKFWELLAWKETLLSGLQGGLLNRDVRCSMVPIVTSQGHPQKDVGFWLRTRQVLSDPTPYPSHPLPFCLVSWQQLAHLLTING